MFNQHNPSNEFRPVSQDLQVAFIAEDARMDEIERFEFERNTPRHHTKSSMSSHNRLELIKEQIFIKNTTKEVF